MYSCRKKHPIFENTEKRNLKITAISGRYEQFALYRSRKIAKFLWVVGAVPG